MNRTWILAGLFMLFASGLASAQEKQKPATGVSTQSAVGSQGSVSAGPEGASATGAAAGSADVAAGQSTASLAQGTEVSATLTKPVDAGKAKPGDPVEARAAKDVRSGGEVVVPRGSRLLGRVTRAVPHGGGSAGGKSESQLGIVFDRARLKDGREVALNGAVTALAAARAAGSAGSSGAGGAGARSVAGSTTGSAGGIAGTVGGTVGGVVGVTGGTAGQVGAAVGGAASAAARSPGAIGGFDVGGNLKSGSHGVFGLRDLEITGATEGAAEGSVISSAKRNVHLEGGTQMLVVAGARAAEQSAESAAPADNPGREVKDDKR
ncbi:MAG: hypothetical protein ACT4UQ_10820 [Gammaproteobacteria bacterium]